MKKVLICFLTFALVTMNGIYVGATGIWGSVCVFDEFGNRRYGENLRISIGFLEESEYRLSNYGNLDLWEELDEETKGLILSNIGKGEYFTIFELKYGNIDDIQEIGTLKVILNSMITYGSGKRSELMGNEYRVYYLNDGSLEEVDIKQSDKESVCFETDELGNYILYYNPNIYNVKFYSEYPEDTEEPFYVVDNLGKNEVVEFPEIPKKEGYVFTGWKHEYWKGMYTNYFYIDPSNITAFDLWKVYASWCPEEEYTPLEVLIESETTIRKGKEDGAEIILKLSEGKFAEIIDSDIENDWKIVGNDELSIGDVERVDDTTAKLTLSGNSSDKYTNGEIQVEFNSELYISHGDYANMEAHEIADIQLDENGIKKTMFISDNTITLKKQSRGGGGVTKHTVEFETNGGEPVESVRVANGHSLGEPDAPLREGYVFNGWYSDSSLAEKYEFDTPITGNTVLYAAWEKKADKTIVFTVGKKEVVVFGETVTNDVAPILVNNRVLLPVRFVAENLGATVSWSKDNATEIKITKGETEIILYIGESYAIVNGEKCSLDNEVIMENDRAYVSEGFFSKYFGCTVTLNDEAKTVKIELT